jgi:hypothetical protein
MRWFKPDIRNSLSAFLGSGFRPDAPSALEPLRRAMLAALGDSGAQANPQLRRRIAYAGDAQALWYARAELVAVLSQLHGEARAVETVQCLTPLFKGLLPRGMLDGRRWKR